MGLIQAPGRRADLPAAWRASAPPAVERRIGPWAFAAVAVASLGGPLALAALQAPGIVADAADSAGLATLVGAVAFLAPLAIWIRYAREITGPAGLTGFVEAAAGRRLALVQAAIWTVSYVLYLAYTTVQIVYDLLPAVFSISGGVQTALAVLIPVSLAAVMIAGRAATLIVIGAVAVGQLALAAILDGVTLAHVSTPLSTFGAGASRSSLATAGAQTSVLYVCASLPLFLGGELARPARTIRRGLTGVYALTVAIVLLAVAPLAAAPGLGRTDVPGVRIAQQFSGPALADAIGVGIAVSIAGVMLCEYLAVTRLVHAVGGWAIRPVAIGIGILIVAVAPLTLLDPHGVYDALLKPSLAALWVSQLMVFAVYPRFAIRRGQPALFAWALTLVAGGVAGYGLWMVFQQASS